MDDQTRIEVEAAVFRRMVHHFRQRTDVQNIDVMNNAGFCRNCLSKWYRAAAAEHGDEMSYDDARTLVYGMTYAEWKANHQTDAAPKTQQRYTDSIAEHGEAGESWFDDDAV
jgi:hypothetical protein